MRRLAKLAVIGILVCSSPIIRASSALLRAGERAVPVPASVATFGGAVQFTSSPVRPASPIAVLWLIDTFDEQSFEKARTDLIDLARQLPGRPLRLLILRGNNIEARGPFAGNVGWKKKLDAVELKSADPQLATPPGADSAGPAATLDALYQNVPAFGTKWSSVLIVGHFAALPPSVVDYASALLVRALNAQQVRAFFQVESASSFPFITVASATAGGVIQETDELPEILDERKQSFLSVSWTPAPAPRGFVVATATIADNTSTVLLRSPDLADQGGSPVSISAYAAQQSELEDVSKLIEQPLDQSGVSAVRTKLTQAQQVNPADPSLLRLEAIYCERAKAYPEEVEAAAMLAQVHPSDGSTFALLGHAQLLTGAFDESEKSLIHATELGIAPAIVAEDIAGVHLARKDDSGALPYLQTALSVNAKRQDLWFLQAGAAERTKQFQLAIKSLEQGLALGGLHIAECKDLINLYLSGSQTSTAKAFAMQTIHDMPPDAAARAEFAHMLEDAKLREEALAGWNSVIAVRGDMEVAHVRVARLLLELGKLPDSLQSASNDLATFPKNPDLYLVKADALQQLNRDYELHSTVEEGASATGSVDVLSRLATIQDGYGFGSAEAYQNLAQKLGNGSTALTAALERGCFVAVREGDLEMARKFSSLLGATDRNGCHQLLGTYRKSDASVMISGGRDALAMIVGAKKGIPADRFLLEYARVLDTRICSVCTSDPFRAKLRKYFETVAELESIGKRSGNIVTIEVAASGKSSRQATESLFKLLGLELSNHGGALKVTMGSGENKGNKQEVMSALGIDEVGLAEALEANKPYTITIADEPVGVYPDETLWQSQLPNSARGNLVSGMSDSVRLARLYLAIGSMDRYTLVPFLGAVSLESTL